MPGPNQAFKAGPVKPKNLKKTVIRLVGYLTRSKLPLLFVLLCLTVHEACHGLAACALGDPTAKTMRRLSFNPLHHIDWLGLAAMLV